MKAIELEPIEVGFVFNIPTCDYAGAIDGLEPFKYYGKNLFFS